MVVCITDTDHSDGLIEIGTEREKAWHLFALLLNLGRPACVSELATRCNLFDVSPDFVEFLCLIPNSPICLAGDRFVTVSVDALACVGEFLSKAVARYVPWIVAPVSGLGRLCGGGSDCIVRTYFRKRKRNREDGPLLQSTKRRLFADLDGDCQIMVPLAKTIWDGAIKGHISIATDMTRNTNLLTGDTSIIKYDSSILIQEEAMIPLLLGSNADYQSKELMKVEPRKDDSEGQTDKVVDRDLQESVLVIEYPYIFNGNEIDLNFPKSSVLEFEKEPDNLISTLINSEVPKENLIYATETINRADFVTSNFLEAYIKSDAVEVMDAGVYAGHLCEAAKGELIQEEAVNSCKKAQSVLKAIPGGVTEDLMPINETAQMHSLFEKDSGSRHLITYNDLFTPLGNATVKFQAVCPLAEPSYSKKQPSSFKGKGLPKDISIPGPGVLHESSGYHKDLNSSKRQEQHGEDHKYFPTKEKLKKKRTHNMHPKNTGVQSTSIASNVSSVLEEFCIKLCRNVRNKLSLANQLEAKELPNFEAYIIKEEEGSGGYGTVYRAQRKSDGKTFAIKCPHAKAHAHHVNNELKMLKRFGGRNYVIKYEGSFSSNNSECLVLEHIEHDRPEVLKREIDVYELRWYAYCMFKALASLHKQGIMHRDVKPGNFLFSRRLNKGYLIDFNLAMDLHQKYGHTGKLKTTCSTSFEHVPLPSTKSALPTKGGKVMGNKVLEAMNRDTLKRVTKPLLESKTRMMRGSGADHLKRVLVRSLHQNFKVDVWSAGVTLLFLMIGKSPFVGDPEQNIKDISKLRGSEDLWEVAKLHNRESSFPMDLFDIQFLPSIQLEDWCKMNTKRPEFLELIPRSLFDLVDKCLTVNPRLRISAEEVLEHKFFDQCHEEFRKLRLQRRRLIPDSVGAQPSNA
ncbi:hypothetical protein GIB67_012481 [Kingdonia uniflora]|uniref:non-specific serine/threonine protein kinase n=1 Tax=Kingdonia uniflora TaxID=39325 RepID=A0A7J7MVW7_9MAGN|nr:hypothetical protein GIB67_012481 [Kingdonia uniflora]